VPCRCATFSSRRNATTLFNFETVSCWRVAYNLGTCFTNGLGDQNLNRVCCLCSFPRSACNSFLSTTRKLTNCCHQTARTHTKTHPFLSEYLSEPSPPFCFHFILSTLTFMVVRGAAAERNDDDGTVAS